MLKGFSNNVMLLYFLKKERRKEFRFGGFGFRSLGFRKSLCIPFLGFFKDGRKPKVDEVRNFIIVVSLLEGMVSL